MKYVILHSMTPSGLYRYMVYKDTEFITWALSEGPREDAVPAPEGVILDDPPPVPG